MSQEIKCVEVVEGWLHVWEVDRLQEERVFCSGYRPEPQWEPKFCVFTCELGSFMFYDSEQNSTSECQDDSPQELGPVTHTRLDGGPGCFHSRWGYKVARKPTGDAEKQSCEPCESEDENLSTKKVDEQRRESLPSPTARSESLESVYSTFRLVNFFIKKGFNNNHKSSVQTERKGSSSSMSDHGTPLLNVKDKSARSHESLLPSPTGMRPIDLSEPNLEVKPLHSSVLGEGHCLHVSTAQGSKYISCTTSQERDRWLSSLRHTIRPQDEHSRRSDSSLKVWILEAKNVTPKKRYYCDILLDQTLYAKTSIKTMVDMLFWGEHFEFKNLPNVELLTINLYREAEKKKKKDKNMLVGYINLSIAEFENRQLTEKWINCHSGTVGKTGKETKTDHPIIRLKARRQTVDILPLEYYQPFIKYLCTDYKDLCQTFEPLMAIREKEDFATCLVHVLQKQGKACDFLSDIVMEEISRLDDEHLTFRGNSIATKAMEVYMKLVGEKYLHATLGDLINQLTQSPDDCEVDPTKVATPQLLICQQKNLDMYSNMAWVKVINSFCYFPNELREVFTNFRSRCTDRGKGDYSDNLISGCIFLRFLCPAILYPSLFNLTQEYPNERASRTLTLIAKTIQTLANFTKFGIKEEYMTFMNEFVERESPNMTTFLHKISSREASNQFLEFDGEIDLGKELSVLYALLLECANKYSETAAPKLEHLNSILSSITSAFEDPTVGHQKPKRQSQMYDNLLCVETKDIPQTRLRVSTSPGDRPQTRFRVAIGPGDSRLQNPFRVASGPAQMETTPLQSAHEDLANILPRHRESTDGLSDNIKTSSDSQTDIKMSGSSHCIDNSLGVEEPPEGAHIRHVFAVKPCQAQDEQSGQVSVTGREATTVDADGDYVDLIPFLEGVSVRSSLEQTNHMPGRQHLVPLAFANPLFRHQQLVHQSRQAETAPEGHETHHGVRVSQAQSVRRLSSDSSTSSGSVDEDEVPWHVRLTKTSSPLVSSAPSEQQSPSSPLEKINILTSFANNDGLNEQSMSSINSPSFYSCSPDFAQSSSTSFISHSSVSTQNYSSAMSFMSDATSNGYSTFPRRQRGQQEPTHNNITSSALLAKETKNTPSGRDAHSTSLAQRGPTFQRQLSNPSYEGVHNTPQTTRIFLSRDVPSTNQTVHVQPKNVHGGRSFPRVFSATGNSRNQILNASTDHQSPVSSLDVQDRDLNTSTVSRLDVQDRDFNTSSTSLTSYRGYLSPRIHQNQSGSSHIASPTCFRNNSSTPNISNTSSPQIRSINMQMLKNMPPASIKKSTGWQIALHVGRSTSLHETWGDTPGSPVLSTHSSLPSMQDSNRAHISASSSSQMWGYTPPNADYNSSSKSHIGFQRRTPEDSCVSLCDLDVSGMSLNSSNLVKDLSSGMDSGFLNPSYLNTSSENPGHIHIRSGFSTPDLLNNTSGVFNPGHLNIRSQTSTPSHLNQTGSYRKISNMAAFTARLQNLSDSQTNSARLQSLSDSQTNSASTRSSSFPQLPAFLSSKYAVVHPHTSHLSHTTSSTRAASYHSSNESTKTGSKLPCSFTTSRSLDLGHLYRATSDNSQTSSTDSTVNLTSEGLSPTGPCTSWLLSDDKSIQPASVVTSPNRELGSRSSPQSTVHLGVNSVLKRLMEQQKTKQEYEKEVHVLRQQLLEAQERLHETEMRLLDHDMDTHKLMDQWQDRLVESEHQMRKQQEEKDEQMKTIITRLHLVEDELKREHAEMVNVVEHKQRVIEVQEGRIDKLDEANRTLLQALSDLEGRPDTVTIDENSNSTYSRVFNIDGFRKKCS